MRKHLISLGLASLLALTGPAQADSTPPAEPSEAAMTFVAGFADTHLSGMLQRIGARQPVMVAASQIDSQILIAVFEAEISQAVKVHGPAWQRNLARSWTPLLSDDELLSLTTEGAQSPHTEKYLELRTTAGQSMQALSQDLFREIMGEVIQKTMTQMGELEEGPTPTVPLAPPADDTSADEPAKKSE